MEEPYRRIKEGWSVITKKGGTFKAVEPHCSADEPGRPFIVYDRDGNSYFGEDIDMQATIVANTGPGKESTVDAGGSGSSGTERERVVFSKFHVPEGITHVQAVLVCSRDGGSTWGDQIPAEHTIACPGRLDLLPLTGDRSRMKELGHNLLEDMWRDGFNACLQLFLTGSLEFSPMHGMAEEGEI